MADLTAEGAAPAAEPQAKPGQMLAADGTPLKKSLARALRRQKLRALMLIAPLLVFVLVSFITPIGQMLYRSVQNDIVADTLPRTAPLLAQWDATTGALPSEDVYEAFYVDLSLAIEQKIHTRLGVRLNYEKTGFGSLFRQSGRRIGRFDTDAVVDGITAAEPSWAEPAAWHERFQDPEIRAALPSTTWVWDTWAQAVTDNRRDPATQKLKDYLFVALWWELRDGLSIGIPSVDAVAAIAGEIPPINFAQEFANADEDWADPEIWATIQTYSPRITSGYFLNAVDLKLTPEGVQAQPEDRQILIKLFMRTLWMSLAITATCILLGYPVAWILANLPTRQANLLLILVLLPFWTSLLVRTSAWKVMLQQQGVINDVLVWIGLVADDERLVMINNQLGTIIAMTHILLPFMILPMYSVMQTIPPSYLRAAKSLGATNLTAFWRVYFPQSIPGIGAGSILVFILAIGYYITPEIVGGTKGVFISNRIAYHISSSLNWGLAAALGTILLGVVLLLYWCYDRIVGIDNVKLG